VPEFACDRKLGLYEGVRGNKRSLAVAAVPGRADPFSRASGHGGEAYLTSYQDFTGRTLRGNGA
jgi:hypothetical protein